MAWWVISGVGDGKRVGVAACVGWGVGVLGNGVSVGARVGDGASVAVG